MQTKIIFKAAVVALAFESVLGLLFLLTFRVCGSWHGLIGVIASVAWRYHIVGLSLAPKLSDDSTTFWLITFLVGLLQAFIIAWLLLVIRTRVFGKLAS